MSSISRLLYRSFSSSLPIPSQTNTATSLGSLSNDLYKEHNLKKLVEKFKKFSESDRFRTKTGIYESTVRRLASAKRFRWIEEILEDQKKYRDISKEGFAVRLISLYGKSGMFDHASKVFDEMPKHECDRTVKSFNALLGACVYSKKFDKADGYFRELPEKLSIKPDVVSYNTLIKAFCEMGSLDSAVSMVDEMEKNGVDPDLITFNTLLDVFYGNNRFVDGEKIWSRMEKKNVVPDIRSYNAKLVGLVSEKKMSEAVKLVEDLGTKELKPDIFSYNALIRGYCEDGDIEEAKRWYGQVANSGCASNKATFSMLVPFVCEKGDFDFAFLLCKKIFDVRCLVDVALLQLVVDGLVKESKIEEAKMLVELGKSNNYTRYNLKMSSVKILGTKKLRSYQMSSPLYRRLHGLFTTTSLTKIRKPVAAAATTSYLKPYPPESSVSPEDKKFKALVKKFKVSSNSERFRHRNYYAYVTTVRRLAAAKQLSYIEDILEYQKKFKDITNEPFTVRLMSLYGKSGMFEHAHNLFNEMPQLNCERTVMSFNALLAACVNSKSFEKIEEFFRELPGKLLIEPDRVSYNTVVKAFCEMNSLDAALLVIDEMKKNGVEPDLITFNTLLHAFYGNNRFSEAEKLWALMEDKNIVPNVRSYNAKLRGLVSGNRIPDVVELIEEMRRKGLKPDIYSFNTLIKGFCDNGSLEEAKRWFGEMVKNDCAPERATFKILLPFVCDKGDFDFALELCRDAINRRCLIDKAAMQLVVDGLIKDLKIEEANVLLELGKSNNYRHYKLKMPVDE
ncbi:hypothetical protein F0562_014154 [Nyssa sinensis]|uniref:Pentacotripeptide-repeat region of PRORP domain-containing protein n=1 Tax=Nyssa sinensis TaxID=561372 RepID=A0A5J4ZQE9_9ASTE|nr:hypothetical protein F0562_014154 [Nyssa sinensis]